jgi:PPK2 family polyphosphate:nucleotide phosphotransferase
MPAAVPSPWLVPFDGSFRIAGTTTEPPDDAPRKKECKHRLKDLTKRIEDLQRVLYADDSYALLLIFQAMDAAGKDGTIRAIFEGVDPTGCQVYSFKQPSAEELDHDFLWRTARRLPERGCIGIFNRSYYEEVLVVRVHPNYLDSQKLPDAVRTPTFWADRLDSIRDHERHLARNGVAVVKFFLNVSKEEQRKRFLSRLDEPDKNWKFSTADLAERGHWDAYQDAYEEALSATSRPWAPWYALPADNKRYMRMTAADIVVRTLESMDLSYPEVEGAVRVRFDEMRRKLEEG